MVDLRVLAVSALAVTCAALAPKTTEFLGQKIDASTMSQSALNAKIAQLKAANPLFAEATCTTMFETKMSLGGPVPPNEHVAGCTEVCEFIKAMKEYWSAGANAEYACGKGHEFGCAYDGVPPVSIKEVCP
jgi:hypothetical protein